MFIDLLFQSLLALAAERQACTNPATQSQLKAFAEALAPARLPGKTGFCPWLEQPPAETPPSELKSAKLPVKLQNGKIIEQEIKYGIYRTSTSDHKARPLVVSLGGGPGISFLDKGRPFVPEGYDVMVIDYPGTGKNKAPIGVDPDSYFSAENAAKAVSVILDNEHPKNYAIWSQSYGTVVATELGSHFLNGKNLPKGILFEGTLGRATRELQGGSHEIDSGYIEVTNKAYAKLSGEEQRRLSAIVSSLKSLTNENTSAIAELFNAALTEGPDGTADHLREVMKRTPRDLLTCIKARAKEKMENPIQTLYAHAGCEVADVKSPNYKIKLYGGILETSSAANLVCYCSPSKIKGTYDSKRHQINNIPLFYLQGTEDANTPIWQARYHYDNQETKDKSFSVVRGAGHAVLTPDVPPPCLEKAWEIIFSGKAASIEPKAVCPPPPNYRESPFPEVEH